MKILLLKSTIVDGEHKEEDWEGEVSFKEGSTLVSMGKAEEIKDEAETVAVSLAVDVTNSEEFKQMQDENKTIKEANSSLIVAKEDAENSLQIAEENLEEHKGEITRLNNVVEDREAEYKTLYDDVFSLSLKDLKAKYSNPKVEENEA